MKYVCVATEYLTKWAEVRAIPNKSAECVHDFLMGLVHRFGSCKVLLHDQGREFNNNLVNDLYERMGMGMAMTSAYHTQSNGLTERFNQTLVSHLMRYVNNEATNWDRHLQSVAFAHRVSA